MVFDKERIENVCEEEIRNRWYECPDTFPEFLTEVSEPARRMNENFIEKQMAQLQKLLKSYRNPLTIRYFWKRKWERLIHRMLMDEPVLGIAQALSAKTIGEMRQEFARFIKAATGFDKAISMEEIGQAARNYLVYDVFTEIHEQVHNMMPAIFGYSMLYPYTDNYIDDPACSREQKHAYNRMIADRLLGKQVRVTDPYWVKTCKLLDHVTGYYEGDARKDIQNGLLLMLEAQHLSLSQTQKDGAAPLTADEIFHISAYKGGISVLVDRFYVPKEISKEDFIFYLRYGFFLQLTDDLQDITEDRNTGRQTLFTRAASVCCVTLEQTLNRLFHYLHETMKSYSFADEKLEDFMENSCYLLLIYSAWMSRENFEPDYIGQFEPFLPLSFSFIEARKDTFSCLMNQAALKDIMQNTL